VIDKAILESFLSSKPAIAITILDYLLNRFASLLSR
jgi:hypothetical protein